MVLERDGWRCRSCGRAGALEVDHIVPLEAGGDPWALDNQQALCKECHADKTRSERGGKPQPRVDAWVDLVARYRVEAKSQPEVEP